MRHGQHHVVSRMARAVRAFAVTAAIGAKFAIEAVAQERVFVNGRLQHDASARAAIAAGRPAVRHIFFAPERNAAVPAVAGLHVDFGFVNKHGVKRPSQTRRNLTEYDTRPVALHIRFRGWAPPARPAPEWRLASPRPRWEYNHAWVPA